jgi:hypothetical protein
MRIDNAFSYMMDRGAGSSKVGTPPRYDADDCHEYVPSTICKLHLLTHLPSCQIPGYSQRVFFSKPCNFFSYLMRICLVFGYTEYKGKQKEIFDAAINGV